MDREKLFKKLSIESDVKMVLVVLDGLGGLPVKGRTELETAVTPHLDWLAAESELGQTLSIGYGITPGSGPAHLALFGYDPLRYDIGRGILEALGVGVQVGPHDLAVRGNFASLKEGLVVDRRAGRISSEQNRKIIEYLTPRIRSIEDVAVSLYAGEEHRFVLVLTGAGLSADLSDADPEAVPQPIRYAEAKNDGATKTARVVNAFIDRLNAELKDFFPANTCLLRGYATLPVIPSLSEMFGLRSAAIAVYPMYRGLAQLVGMEVLPCGRTIEEQVAALKENFSRFDFFFMHVKKTDSYGEDGLFEKKVAVVEEFDTWLPAILELTPAVLAITGDHSTPTRMKAHSWHPNPFLLKAQFQRIAAPPLAASAVPKFGESSCVRGVWGTFPAMEILPLMMANAGRFKKYGA